MAKPFVFVHVPKTAGTSIASALGLQGRNHYTLEQHKKINLIDWDITYKFGFVRNPWDRLVSVYSFAQVKGDFKRWLFDFSPRTQQYEWLQDKEGNQVDFVGRFENLERDFAIVCDKLEIDAQLDHLNRSNHQDYKSFYDQESQDYIAKAFKDDIERFGYSF